MCVTLNLLLRPVQALEDLALLGRHRHEHFGALAGHAHQAHLRLGVAVCNVPENNADSIGLRLKPRRVVVAVPTALAVVHQDHHRFHRHLGLLCWGAGRPCSEVARCLLMEKRMVGVYQSDVNVNSELVSVVCVVVCRCDGWLDGLWWVWRRVWIASNC